MSDTGLLKKLLGIDLAVVESARTGEEDGSLAVEVLSLIKKKEPNRHML